MISGVRETVAKIEARPLPKENLVPHTACFIEEIDLVDWEWRRWFHARYVRGGFGRKHIKIYRGTSGTTIYPKGRR